MKLRDDYNERKAEFAEVLRANKLKARMRAQLGVGKLLTGVLSLDELCP